ncbi:hypothetical protein DEI93_15985 [Curtobacterium sp. MCBD17_035]|uniref:hypothetical protein n=1 Tax=Curtobacterium sp. MCBD17_035 TaxID=2175673 RepID=UPI0015E884D8|nr:hypothetical protein [Curtobacterium sp. MCBD17_035]WIB67429.1 hypothetical protein DEI93_15985 [Curtobacterium sp. MCBD17_035]
MTCQEVRHLSRPPSTWRHAGQTPPHEYTVLAEHLVIQHHPQERGCRCDPTDT